MTRFWTCSVRSLSNSRCLVTLIDKEITIGTRTLRNIIDEHQIE